MSAVTEAQLLEALKSIVDPHTGRDFVSARQVKNLRIEGGDVAFDVELGYPAKSQFAVFRSIPLTKNLSLCNFIAFSNDGSQIYTGILIGS